MMIENINFNSGGNSEKKVINKNIVSQYYNPCLTKKKQNKLTNIRKNSKLSKKKTISADLGGNSEGEDECLIPVNSKNNTNNPRRLYIDQEKKSLWDSRLTNLKLNSRYELNNIAERFNYVDCDFLYRDSDETNILQSENYIHNPKICTKTESDFSTNCIIGTPVRCYKKKKINYITDSSDPGGALNSKNQDIPLCVISSVVGNAKETFENCVEKDITPEYSVITLKKTNDITKIKGWRRKQFFIEKPTTIEFYSSMKNSSEKKKIFFNDAFEKEPENTKNAFVCDSLDEFLDNEAELKVNYEVPHLYAELGIKLTKEDVLSKPNFSEEEFKKLGNKYCVKLPYPDNFFTNVFENINNEKEQKSENVESYKIIKIGKSKRRFVKIEQKLNDIKKLKQKPVSVLKRSLVNENNFVKLEISDQSFDQIKNCSKDFFLTTKLLGVVFYPNSFKPVHPIVEKHLNKLRSFYTTIDKNWADFATSALGGKWQNKQINRKILPVYCTGKIRDTLKKNNDVDLEIKNVVKFLVDSVCEKNRNCSLTNVCNVINKKKINKENSVKPTKNEFSNMNVGSNFLLKECKVFIKKLKCVRKYKLWCMEHNCYDCSLCGFVFCDSKSINNIKGKNGLIQVTNIPRLLNSEYESSQSLFNERITNLLGSKLRSVAYNDDIVESIDKLKALVPNGLELIKLNFVKQSFLTGYINIWFLQPESSKVRSRAFLTFSKAPPVPKAINIRRHQNFSNDFPKVISEIVSSEDVFDDDEYAILYCNGNSWEIHGALNIGLEKKDDVELQKNNQEVEQIFIPVPPVEMDDIRKIATQILRVTTTKWWILDLTQNFTEIVLNISCHSTVITKKHLLAIIKSKFLGFLAMKKQKGRLYGVYVLHTLFPFILVGPYYTFEKCTLFLRSNTLKIPFDYVSQENLPHGSSLKYVINSVVTELEGSDKKLEGLWLYDKKNLDNALYLEAITTTNHGVFPKMDYSLETEHGYGLNSLTYGALLGTSANVLNKSKDGKISLEVPIYLYFEVFDLGYLTGELENDNSIMISHPLSPLTRVKSRRIGDLFIRMLKKRIKFLPENYEPKWFITRHKEDLGGRKPFDKYCLSGVHILCKNGLCSLLKISGIRIKELGLNKEEVIKAIAENSIISEIFEFKKLKGLIFKNVNNYLPMNTVLKKAKKKIDELCKANQDLLNLKSENEKKNISLRETYSDLLTSDEICSDVKLNSLKKTFDNVNEKFENIPKFIENEKLNVILEKLGLNSISNKNFGEKIYPFKMIPYVEKKGSRKNNKSSNMVKSTGNALKKKKKERSHRLKNRTPNSKKLKLSNHTVLKKLEAKLLKITKILDASENPSEIPKYKQLLMKINRISNQINFIKNIFKGGNRIMPRKSIKNGQFILENIKKIKKTKIKQCQKGLSKNIDIKKKKELFENDENVFVFKNEEKQKIDSSEKTIKKIDELKPVSYTKEENNESDKDEISVVKVVKKNEKQCNKKYNNKTLLNSIVTNKIKNSSATPGKKFIILKRGDNNNTSLGSQKFNIFKAIRVMGKDSDEKTKALDLKSVN